jgi:hypothetical protein
MTREEKLIYARKCGGLLAKDISNKYRALECTLDKAYWNGRSYTFVINVNDMAWSTTVPHTYKKLSFKVVITSKEAANLGYSPVVTNMLSKLNTFI